jgi:hypothetical protein
LGGKGTYEAFGAIAAELHCDYLYCSSSLLCLFVDCDLNPSLDVYAAIVERRTETSRAFEGAECR